MPKGLWIDRRLAQPPPGVWPFFSAPRARDRFSRANGPGDESEAIPGLKGRYESQSRT